jgi:hypothetical protein
MNNGGKGTGDDGVVEVVLVLEPDPEVDREVHERLTRQVRAEIAELDIESVSTLAAETAPAGAKGADPVTLGALVVALSASGGVLTALVETLRDWLGRHTGRHRISVTIGGDTIELDRATSAQQRQLVEAYLRRHRVE